MLAARRHLAAASGLFVLSGFTGLVYETVWFKRLGHAWGSSSLAMACVVATFLAGLGLGAWLFGRLADRTARPLAWYGWCEIAIGVLALAIPYEIVWLVPRAAPLSVSLAGAPAALIAARVALTFLVIGPPCVLMGATLPLLTRQLSTHGLSVGASAAWLYASNTLGAAAGAWCAGFFLLETFGLAWTNGLTALANLAIGAGAVAIAKGVPAPPPSADAEPPATVEHVSRRALFAGAAATGLASIALQMLWARQLALLVGATTYAFSATVAVFILGLGIGSLVFRLAFADAPRLERVLCWSAALVVVSGLAGHVAQPEIALVVANLRSMRGDGGFNAALCASVAAALQLLPAIGMGLVFPALVQLSRGTASRAGRSIGSIYAWNTAGSIVGASTTALALLPALGSHWTLRFALLAYGVLPFVLLGARRAPAVTAIAAIALLFSSWRKPDPLPTNLGLFMYGAATRARTETTMHTVFFEEGASCNVLVMQNDEPAPGEPLAHLNLRVNGKVDASSSSDMSMQIGISYVPMFLRPKARTVAVIGMGSGATTGAAALFPGAEVTVCEIEPAIVEATRQFEAVNHRPLARDNVRVVVDDGRSFVQGHPGPWDLILSEPSNPWIAGVANLFTEDFYRAVRSKLSRDGLFVQWVQTYSFTREEYALIVRTVLAVFPRCALYRISPHDTLLVAGPREIAPDAAAIDAAQAAADGVPEIAGDLERYFGTRDVRSVLLRGLWLDEGGLKRFVGAVGGSELNTDANMRLEFLAPRRLFQEDLDPYRETTTHLLAALDPDVQQRLLAQWRCGAEQLGALKDLKTHLLQAAQVPSATAMISYGLAYEPDDPELLVDRLLFDATVDPAEFEATCARVIERSPAEALRLATQLTQLGQHNASRMAFEALTVRYPHSASAWRGLGLTYEALKRPGDAAAAVSKARELDPLDDFVLPTAAQ
jgi:spermidine synthase